MNTSSKAALFGLVAGLVFGGAYAGGRLVDPISERAAASTHESGHGDAHGGGPDIAEPTGLAATERGYRMELVGAVPEAGVASPVEFRIVGPDGEPVTSYRTTHEKQLHLIVARTDLSAFRHVHPELHAGGRWRVVTTLPSAGTWRLYADFQPAGAGEPLTLSSTIDVPGTVTATPPAAPSTVAHVDGYEVTLGGELRAGATAELAFTVRRDGVAVDDLDTYLGAPGHLVALRSGDGAYLHVHPLDERGHGPTIAVAAEVPSPGAYRLFLDFQHRGTVHTAAFTVVVPDTAPEGSH